MMGSKADNAVFSEKLQNFQFFAEKA